MAAPTFVQHAESAWDTTTTPKTATVTVQTGDILVVGAAAGDGGSTLGTPTNDGTALTWTLRQDAGTNGVSARTAIWTAVADSSRAIIVTGTRAGVANPWGFAVEAWRGSDGVGTSNIVNGDTTANFSVDLTGVLANSAIFTISADWTPVTGTRTYLTATAGAFTEKTGNTPGDVAAQYSIRSGYHADAGATGTKTIGSSAPAGQKVTIAAVEIKGSAAGTTQVSATRRVNYAVQKQVAATRRVTYNVLANVAATRRIAYSVQAAVSATRRVRYDVLAAVAATRRVGYVVGTTQVAATRRIAYSVQAQIAQTKRVVYGVLAQVAATRSIAYGVNAAVVATRRANYSVQANVTGQRRLTYVVGLAPTVSYIRVGSQEGVLTPLVPTTTVYH